MNRDPIKAPCACKARHSASPDEDPPEIPPGDPPFPEPTLPEVKA